MTGTAPHRENPALFPASADRAGVKYNPTRLGDGATYLKNAAYPIAAALMAEGYTYPHHHVIDCHARLETSEIGILVSFPPPAPRLGDTVTVIDPDGNSAEVPFAEVTADTLGDAPAGLWFDLDTGAWVTFSTVPLPAAHSTPYHSRALRFPLPLGMHA